MAEEAKTNMQCPEFEELLLDAVEGTLEAARMKRFQSHATLCAICGPLFAEARAGRDWMKSLTEVDPPRHLVHNILAATTGLEEQMPVTKADPVLPMRERLRVWLGGLGVSVWAGARQPRFAMSAAMAFFTISLALNVTGTRVSDFSVADLRPSSMVRNYHLAQGRIVKYYTNIRFVYEFESRVRELQRVNAPAEGGARPQEKQKNDNTSRKPQRKSDQQQQNEYSREGGQVVLAGCARQHSMQAATRRLA
jgi:hypothetical protein